MRREGVLGFQCHYTDLLRRDRAAKSRARAETLADAGAGIVEPDRRPRACQAGRGGKTRRSPRQGLRRRSLRRVRKFHSGAKRHLHEVRHVRVNDGVFVRATRRRTTAGLARARYEEVFQALNGPKALRDLFEHRARKGDAGFAIAHAMQKLADAQYASGAKQNLGNGDASSGKGAIENLAGAVSGLIIALEGIGTNIADAINSLY